MASPHIFKNNLERAHLAIRTEIPCNYIRTAGIGGGIFLLTVAFPKSSFCLVYHFTGLPCPVCGGTRAVLSLMKFDPVQSFRWNPGLWVAVTAFAIALVFLPFTGSRYAIASRVAWIAGITVGILRMGICWLYPYNHALHLCF